MDKIIKEIIKEPCWEKYYNDMKNKNNKEILDILGKTLNNNVFSFKRMEEDINNFDSLSHYDKYNTVNHIDNYKGVAILIYILRDKNNI